MPVQCCGLLRCCGFVKKIIRRKTVAIHNIFKEKNYKAQFLTSSILKKKTDKDGFKKKSEKKMKVKKIKKNQKKTKVKKKTKQGNIVAIYSVS